jgi:signal transduction histidine kinase
VTDHFDRQLSLVELFTEKEITAIQSALSCLLGQELTLEGADSPTKPGHERTAISWDLEPIGYVVMANGSEEQLQAAATLLDILVQNAARYRMAKDIHQEIITIDYEALQKKHQALQESEARYKELYKELEQKVAEQVQTIQAGQTKLYQAEKQAAVGHLAAGMAHEINTPLAYIQNNFFTAVSYQESLQAIQKEIKKEDWTTLKTVWQDEDMDFILEDFPTLLADSLEGIKKVAKIVADLKIFSNIDRTEMTFDDINARLQTVLHVLHPQIPDSIEVLFEPEDLPLLSCDPACIGQVFYSLLHNSIQAIDGQGQIFIHTTTKGGEIQISIRDTGKGIAPEHLPHIFDPFFTTKEVGQGTGLGLAVCHDIIKAHGGSIRVTSKPEAGTTFTIAFPSGQ